VQEAPVQEHPPHPVRCQEAAQPYAHAKPHRAAPWDAVRRRPAARLPRRPAAAPSSCAPGSGCVLRGQCHASNCVWTHSCMRLLHAAHSCMRLPDRAPVEIARVRLNGYSFAVWCSDNGDTWGTAIAAPLRAAFRRADQLRPVECAR
jgi:hypothetical protein